MNDRAGKTLLAIIYVTAITISAATFFLAPSATNRGLFSKALDGYRHHPVMSVDAKLALLDNGACQRMIFGSSRVEFAFDPRHPLLIDMKTCNLGVSAASIRDQMTLVQRAIARGGVREIIWAFDFAAFHTKLHRYADGFEQSWLERFGSLASWSEVERSIDLIRRYFAGQKSGYTHDGYLRQPAFKAWTITRFKNDWDLYVNSPTLYRSFSLDIKAFETIKNLLDSARANAISVRSVILPVHIAHLAMIRRRGLEAAYSIWRTKLKQVTQESGSLIDFASADSPNDEAISLNQEPMKWFWDSNHVTADYGNRLIYDLFAATRSPATSRVDPESAESGMNVVMKKTLAWEISHAQLIRRFERD